MFRISNFLHILENVRFFQKIEMPKIVLVFKLCSGYQKKAHRKEKKSLPYIWKNVHCNVHRKIVQCALKKSSPYIKKKSCAHLKNIHHIIRKVQCVFSNSLFSKKITFKKNVRNFWNLLLVLKVVRCHLVTGTISSSGWSKPGGPVLRKWVMSPSCSDWAIKQDSHCCRHTLHRGCNGGVFVPKKKGGVSRQHRGTLWDTKSTLNDRAHPTSWCQVVDHEPLIMVNVEGA